MRPDCGRCQGGRLHGQVRRRGQHGKADIILLGPQVRYLKSRIEERAEGKPVEVIDMMAYGTMDGKKVYNDIKKHMGDK